MYDKRIKIFIGVSLSLLLLCVLRLMQMQLFADSSLQKEIERLKERRGLSKQLQTLRGKILDRHGRIVAADMPEFQVCINYQLSRYLDDRVVLGRLAQAQREDADPSLDEVREEIEDKRLALERVIAKCAQFAGSAGQIESTAPGEDGAVRRRRDRIESTIQARNESLWKLRSYIRWARSDYDPNLVARHDNIVSHVPFVEAMTDLERQFPDPNERYRRIAEVDDIPEIKRDLPIAELETEDDIFAAQLEFMEIEGVEILPAGHRYYPYGSTAAQTLGWVGPATQEHHTRLFADDPLASYLEGEVCGRGGGVEYVCEIVLRGRRGELRYDIDRQLVRETTPEFGKDVKLTLDLDLQKRIEERMTDPQANPDYHEAPMAAVVLQIASGDILALVSLPSFDLNRARYDYTNLNNDANRPLINRTINRLYPPGSVVKPLILIAGLEAGVVTAKEEIPCPAAPAPAGWPNCWIYKQYSAGHDDSWINNARNAIRGSCNIYFSRVADRLEPRVLQQWLFHFGYGQEIPLSCPAPPLPGMIPRRFRQAPGQIGSTLVSAYTDIESLDQIPPLRDAHRKLFGIGHGNFRVTPLQVANTFATLARGGRRVMPRLFLSPRTSQTDRPEPVDLPISPATLAVARDGMSAVVNMPGGSGHEAFKDSPLIERGVRIYGKTGSTEGSVNAWFAGYAEDQQGARFAMAVVVEGGESGSSDAAPLARQIFELCAEAGYVGNASLPPR